MADIEEVYRRLIAAWNEQDATIMAGCFAPDGEMIGFDGSNVVGRDEIATELAGIFADHETAHFVVKVRGVRELAGGGRLVRAIAGMIPPGRSDLDPDVNTHHTLVVEDGQIVLFQNTPAQFHGRPELVESFTQELREQLEASDV